MSVTTKKFARTPFYVEAVRVGGHNIELIAEWCGGEIKMETRNGRISQYISVEVNNPQTDSQKRAWYGNWVLKTDKGFKVYTDKAFRSCFQEVPSAEQTAEELWGPGPGQEPLFKHVQEEQRALDHKIVHGD